MKKTFITFLWIMLGMSLFGQFPGGFNYQAVVRNTAGEIIANKTVKFRISILQESESGTDVYVETHSVVTGAFGLANLKVGMGTKVSGNLDPSSWGLKKHFLKVELDPNNGNTFSALGTTQLLAVPYAFHAKTVEIDKVNDADADPLNEIQILNLSGTVLSLSKGGGSVTLPSSGSGGDQWGTQTVVTDATLTGNGTTATPLKVADSGISTAKIAGSAVTADKLAGNAVTEAKIATGAVTDGKIATGAVTGGKIAQAGATTGQALKWNGTTWAPANDDAGSGGLTLPYSGQITLNQGNTAFSIKSSGSLAIHAEGTQGSIYATYQGASYHAAILGSATATGGYAYGVVGRSQSTIGTAVYAHNQATSGSEAKGLMAEIASSSGRAVHALSTATSGTSYGIYSDVKSADAYSGYFTGGRFAVLSSKVGIGTSSPAYTMDIAGPVNLNKGITSGAALHVNGLQVLGYYNDVYFAWGHPENHNYFPGRVFIGTTYTSPGTHRLVVDGTAAKPGGGSWTVWSDSRLKDVHGKFTGGLEAISKLEPVKFSYKKDNPVHLSSDAEYIGFIAQEVQKIIPEAVSTGADGFLNFDMHVVNVTLVNAVRELKNENDQLKSRIDHLEAEKTTMAERLERLEILMSAQTGK